MEVIKKTFISLLASSILFSHTSVFASSVEDEYDNDYGVPEEVISQENQTPGEGEEPVTPGEGEESVTPGEGEEPVTPGEGEESVTPGEGEESVTPGEGEESVTPGEGEESVTPGEGEVTPTPSEGTSPVTPRPLPVMPSIGNWTPPRPTSRPVQVNIPEASDEIQNENVGDEFIDVIRFVEVQNMEDDAFGQALTDYISIAEGFNFNDELKDELEGSSWEEVKERFIPQAEPEIIENQDEKVVNYYYYKEGQDIEAAILRLYFNENTLTAISLENGSPNYEIRLNEDQLQKLKSPSITFEEVVNMKPSMIGLVHMKNNNIHYDTLITPSGIDELTLQFIEMSPQYVRNDLIQPFNPDESSLEELLMAFIKLKHANEQQIDSNDEDETQNEIDQMSFSEMIMEHRIYDEEKLIDQKQLKNSIKEVISIISQSGEIEINKMREILGEPTHEEKIGTSAYAYYYGVEDEEVVIVTIQYNTEENQILEISREIYTPEMEKEFPINIEELIEFASVPFEFIDVEKLLTEPNITKYSSSAQTLHYTWISKEDPEMAQIEGVQEIGDNLLNLFYLPAN